MKDIPMFTTEYGVASLALGEVSYRQEAYIQIQTVAEGQLDKLLQECVGFCRACGAEKIYATNAESLEQYPLHTTIYEMRGTVHRTDKALNLSPVTEETLTLWRSLANERLQGVDNAATITAALGKKLMKEGGAYFVHEAGRFLGIGLLQEDTLQLIASVQPGAGEMVLRTLLSAASCDQIRLEVASTNEKAIRLYQRMGFIKTRELRRWYRVFP